MAHRQVIATRTGRYGTRMLTAGDELTLSGPAARAMIALGRAEPSDGGHPRRAHAPAPPPAKKAPAPLSDLGEARKAYKAKFGKMPGPKWSVAEIQAKIAAA